MLRASSQNGLIYQFSVSGSAATLENTTMLDGFTRAQGFYVVGVPRKKSKQGNHIIATSGSNIGIFHYPKGGAAITTLTQNYPWSVVVSKH